MEHHEKYEKSLRNRSCMPTKWNAMTDFTTKVRGTYKDPLSMDLSLLNLKEMQAGLAWREKLDGA